MVRPVDRVERRGAVFDAAANRANLVHSPAQAHRAVTANAAIRRAQAGHTAR